MNMKIGSVVKLVSPRGVTKRYRDALGIVSWVYDTKIIEKTYCIVRFTDKDIPLTHHFIAVYQHEVRVIKE